MKVFFYCDAEESDEYEFPDDTSPGELNDAAADWVLDNVAGWYQIVEDEEDEEE